MKKICSVFILLSIFSASSVFGIEYSTETIFVNEGFAGAYEVTVEHKSVALAGSPEVADVLNHLVEITKAKTEKYAIFTCEIAAYKVSHLIGRMPFTLLKFSQIFDIKNCRFRD